MFTYQATVVKVIDGDTIDCQVDLGFNIFQKMRFRLNGLDTPEKNSNDSATRVLAGAAFEFLKNKIEGHQVILNTYKADKYGRYLCDVIHQGKNINYMLLEKNLAVPYNGGSKDGLWKANE